MQIGSRTFVDAHPAVRSVHGPFVPADVWPGDPVFAHVALDGEHERPFQVWRLSPLGIELLANPESELEPGTDVRLSLQLGMQHAGFARVRVHSRHREAGRELVGIRWVSPEVPRPLEVQRHRAPRWACDTKYLPTGVARSPVRFADVVHFRVREVGSGGLQLQTSLRNKLLVPGMVLETVIDVPTLGKMELSCRIVHVRPLSEDGKMSLLVGVRMLRLPRYARKILGQYVLQFVEAGSTLELLEAAGLTIESGAKAVEFTSVRTADDYRQVLALRALAYQRAGKISEDVSPEAMSDPFDARARILMGRYRGRAVASLRLMFHGEGDGLEHEEYAVLPASLPARTRLVEVTRVCTHPAYRGSDLLLGLFRHGALAVLESGRSHVLGSADAKLLPFYLGMGFREIGVKYRHQALGAREHSVFVGDLQGALRGSGISPLWWNAIFADVWRYLHVNGMVHPSRAVRLRLTLFRCAAPLARLMLARAHRPRRTRQAS